LQIKAFPVGMVYAICPAKAETMRRKILLVDNNPEYRHVIATIVRRVGYEVIQSDQADKATERAMSDRPDLIMMDPALLAVDGVDIAAWLKSNLYPLKIPVLIYTSPEAGSWKNEALSSGAAEILTKPIPFSDLREILRKHLSPARDRPRPIPSPSFDAPLQPGATSPLTKFRR
jgi:two-component system alkaline phosphatase synthesis response regulator PhoP